MIGTYAFIILVRVEKNCWRSLTHAENWYARAGLDFISYCKPTKQLQRWSQPQPPQKVAISIYVIRWKLLFHSTILFLPFPCAYKAKLTWFSDDMMMLLNSRESAWP